MTPVNEPVARLAPGTLVSDRYAIVDLLGEGGMGAVYRAEHKHLRKAVALKVLHPEFCANAEIVARFEREAIAASHIGHPNVAAATDFGRLPDGSFFLVLELVSGRSLRELLDEGPLEAARALRILSGIAEGVGAAHAKGVVHRDLKPENVMLVERGGDADFVKVLDFGIARLDPFAATGRGGGAQPLTRAGAVFGTPDYMSPEQALGQPVDARSDLYALGVIFFEMLTGERPFRGGAVTVLRERVLQALPPELPAEVAARAGACSREVLQKLLMGDAALRFQTAEQLASAIDEALRAAGAQQAAPGPRDRAPAGRKTVVALAGAALVLGGAATLVATLASSGPARGARAPRGSASMNPGEWGAPSATAASTPSQSGSPLPPELPLPPDPEAATSRGTTTAAPPASSRGGRRTGPGGIYIPPPKQWFR